MPKWVRRGAIALVAFAAIYIGSLLAFQRLLLFPRHAVRETPAPQIAELDTLYIDTDEGEVEAWFLPGRGVSAEHPGPLVIFAHGNAEVIDQWAEKLQPYRDRGMSVLLAEYRGYGRSAGDPSQAEIVGDYVRFYDLALERPDVDPPRVVLHGRSLGGGVVCGLARERPPAAVILQSTFTSVPDASPWWAWSALSLDPFDNLACVAELDAPLLVIHGRTDTLIPMSHAERLHAAAEEATLVLYDAGHNDLPPAPAQYWADIHAFLSASSL
jgi:uncharacterized protein